MTKDKLEELLRGEDEVKCQSRPVVVEILDLRWFFALRRNFIAFSTILTAMPTSFYSSKFTKLMID